MEKEQKELLDLIRVFGFNVFDAVLFLDTHPYNEQALAHFNKYQQLLEKAVKEYTNYFGPLTTDYSSMNHEWTWGEGPWPWESEAN